MHVDLTSDITQALKDYKQYFDQIIKLSKNEFICTDLVNAVMSDNLKIGEWNYRVRWSANILKMFVSKGTELCFKFTVYNNDILDHQPIRYLTNGIMVTDYRNESTDLAIVSPWELAVITPYGKTIDCTLPENQYFQYSMLTPLPERDSMLELISAMNNIESTTPFSFQIYTWDVSILGHHKHFEEVVTLIQKLQEK